MPDISLQQLLSTNFSLSPSGYTGSQGAIGYTGSAGTGGSGDAAIPKITNIQVTDNTYTVLDDTAVALTGGYIKITGTGFASGCQVIIGTTTATSTTFVSATEVRAQLPATTAGTYIVYLVNADGGVAIRINGITFSATPTWVTGSTLDTAASDTAISYQLSATGATTYTLQAGSSLPPGLTLSNVGLISGTVTGINNETTYSFTVVAVDAENQDSPRTFSVTITTGDQYWKYTTTLLSAGSTTPFNRDASTNNFAVTINGDTKPFNFNPYTPGYYSNYFDGTGDYLTLGAITTSGDLTLEFWAYRTAAISSFMIPFSNGGNNGWVGWKSNATTFSWDGVLDATIPDTINTWAHYAIVKQSGVAKLYVNGVEYGSASTSSNLTFSAIGTFNLGSYNFTGYLSNVRLVNGTAVYTTAFTPPTAPLTAIANTSLLTCQSNRFIDTSANNFAITKNGDTKVSSFTPYAPNSSYSTYGTTYFDGSGDFLSTPTGPAAFDFTGTKTLTLEFWVNSPAWPSPCCFFDLQECQPFRVLYSPGTISWQSTSNGSTILSASVTLAVNTWYHIAFVRDTDTLYIFVNGAQAATGSYSNNWPSTAAGNVRIGTNRGDTWFVNGYMTDVRLVKGTAVYTSAFTPPTSPLTAISGTSLLTCQSNQPVANNTFLDKSTNDFAITRNGNTTQGTFSPYGENWSNYFDGAGDYLRLSNTVLNNSAFTISFWFYPTTSSVIGLFDSGPGQTSCFRNYPANTIQDQNGGSVSFTANTNQWNWMSIVGDGTNFTVYLNGSSAGSAAYASLVDSSFTIGTINSGGDGAFAGYISNFRIKNVASVDAVPTAPLQPIAGTTLLTCQSNRLIDNSPNNFTLTKNGDVSVQKFGPFAGTTLPTPYYSAYFDGTGDYLQTTSSALSLGTGDFTVECWFNVNSTSNNGLLNLAASYFPASVSGIALYVASNNISMYCANTASAPGGTISPGTWYHVAMVRSSGVTKLYLNGVYSTAIGAVTDTTNYTGTALVIGGYYNNTLLTNGYISDIRLVKGTAVYTANFTPPTSPLTAISGTSLLTCQSSTFIDNSTNNFTITAAGDAKPTTVNPFTVSYSTKQSYTPSVYGGSAYFDGTGDYLTVNDGLHLGTADFTIEFWNYNNVSYVSTAQEFVNSESSGSGVTWSISYSTYNGRAGFAFSYGQYGSYTVAKYVNGEWGKVKAWTHYAVQRRNGVIEIYVDGVKRALTQNDQNGTFSDGANLTSNYTTRNIANGYNGYISDFRITKGSAVYSSNFVPKNTPLQAIKNTTLLVNGTGAGVYDSSTNTIFETVGDAKLSTTTVKFSGTTSIYLDGTGDYLAAPPPPSCMSGELGTGDFTIEYWMNASAAGTYVTVVGTQSIAGNSTAGIWRVGNRFNGANGIYFNYTNGGSFVDLTFSTTNYNDGTWHHVAFVRSSGSLKAYVDGTQVGSAQSVTQNLSSGQRMYVGYNVQDSAYYTGYISDLKITKGIARYTSNFTAPTSPLLNK